MMHKEIIDTYNDVGEGWTPLLIKTFSKIKDSYEREDLDFTTFIPMQVKEKFGGLRIYVGDVPDILYDEVNEIIDQAEDESYIICERCGKPGQLYTDGWWKTLCKEHAR